ncbi:MAG: beta-lactamase family protein [Chloroflexi bacterium]|nr:beta-lactamase family protein [Chloroflexota bacterium]
MTKRITLLCLVITLLLCVAPLTAQDTNILDAIVTSYADKTDPAVAVQVTTPDGVWSAAGGSVDGRRAADVNDRFRIGSMSKTFVAVVALLLAEDGVIALDDPAATYLPAEVVANVENADQVTLRQLLSMRSGISDYLETDEFWSVVETEPDHAWTAAEAITYAYDLPAMFEPDTDYYYSNSNYILLQLILEAVTSQPLHALVRERILDPLGMADTYTQFFENAPAGGTLVDGWEDWFGDSDLDNVTAINDGWGLGDGALISTVGDLTTFYRALLADQTLLNADSMRTLLDFRPDDTGDGYSLGLAEWATDYGSAWGHSGAVLGFVSIGFYLPDADVTVMVLSANADLDVYAVALAALAAVLE